MASEGRAPAANLARRTLKPVSGSRSRMSIRGRVRFGLDCAYVRGEAIEETITTPNITAMNRLCRVMLEQNFAVILFTTYISETGTRYRSSSSLGPRAPSPAHVRQTQALEVEI